MRITGAVLTENGRPAPFAGSRPLQVSELELDPPGPGELLVRIEAAGICHSDLSVVDGNRVRPVPMLLGHEAAGRVVELGEGVDDVAVGDRVVMVFLPRCEQCANCATDGRLPCSVGAAANEEGTLLGGGLRLHGLDGTQVKHHVGVSGFATHAVVSRASVVVVGDDVPPDVAAVLGCAVLTGGGAVRNVAPLTSGTTIVVGLGGVGMAAVITAVSLGVGDVIGVDAVPDKLARALALGANAAYSPADARDAGLQAPLVIEAAGNARAFETAVALTAAGGTTVTVGLPSPDARASIAPLGLTAQARAIVGSYLGSAVPSRDIPVYAQLWREGRLPVEELISSRIALADVNAALDDLAEGRAIRQLIMFDEPEPDLDGSKEDAR